MLASRERVLQACRARGKQRFDGLSVIGGWPQILSSAWRTSPSSRELLCSWRIIRDAMVEHIRVTEEGLRSIEGTEPKAADELIKAVRKSSRASPDALQW